MNFSKKETLEVGDLVEHPADSSSGVPQGEGLITAIAKRSKNSSQNIWHVKFFNGMEFKIMEGYLKKIQGTVDIKE
jgi:hypothetical protein